MSVDDTMESTPATRGGRRIAAPTAELPTLPSQRQMWREAALGASNNAAYCEAFRVDLKGSVDEEVLVRALDALPQIHAILRGRFGRDGRGFFIPADTNFTVERCDLTGVAPGEAKQRLQALTVEYASQPYDLERGPLFRATVVRAGSGHLVVLFGSHHAVCDGWSLDVLLADLSKIYCAMTGAGPFPDPVRPSAADFAAWCDTGPYRARQATARAYWQRVYQVPPPPLRLDPEHGEAKRPTPATHFASHAIQLAQLETIQRFAREHGLSTFTVLYAGLAALLNRITQSRDLVICIPVARHPEAEMEDSVGNFVNVVPVRCAFDEDLSFLGLCRFVHTRLLDAREHASIGLPEITEAIDLDDDGAIDALRGARLVPVHKYTAQELPFGDAAVDYIGVPRTHDLFDLSLYVMQSPSALELRCSVRQHLCDQAWVSSKLDEFEAMLVHGAVAPGTLVDALDPHYRVRGISHPPPAPKVASPPPRNDVELVLLQLFSKKLRRPELGIEDDFFGSGGNNQLGAELIQEIDAALDTQLDLQVLIERPTVVQLAELLKGRQRNVHDMVVPLNRQGQGKPRLFFVCGIALYGPLAKHLEDAYACYGIFVAEEEKYFHDQNNADGMSIEHLASLYIRTIKHHTPNGPYAIAGVSFGAILAFEIARQLQVAGDEVSGLVMLDPVLPGAIKRDWGRTAESVLRDLRAADATRLMGRARRVLGALGAWQQPQQEDGERQARNAQLWAAVRGGATTRYFRDNPTYDGQALVVRAGERPGFEGKRVAHDLGWGALLTGPITIADAPGTHLGILRSPETATLVRKHIGEPSASPTDPRVRASAREGVR